MLNKQLIQNKLEKIVGYCKELGELFKASLEVIKKDFTKYHTAERLLQLIVDEMIDINNHIIKENNFSVPDDFQSTFQILSDNNIIPEDFALKIAPVVGLRNRLVHRYEEIDRQKVLEHIDKERGDFGKYIKLINNYLENLRE